MKQRSQRVARDEEAALHELQAPFERVVFVLHGDDAVVADAVQLRDEPIPADLTEPRRRGTCQPIPSDSTPFLVEALAIDPMSFAWTWRIREPKSRTARSWSMCCHTRC